LLAIFPKMMAVSGGFWRFLAVGWRVADRHFAASACQSLPFGARRVGFSGLLCFGAAARAGEWARGGDSRREMATPFARKVSTLAPTPGSTMEKTAVKIAVCNIS
jgi:hypothetical protein